MGQPIIYFQRNTYINEPVYIALRPRELGGIFHFNKDDEPQIMPDIMLTFYMFLKAGRFVIKTRPLQTYSERKQHPKLKHRTVILWKGGLLMADGARYGSSSLLHYQRNMAHNDLKLCYRGVA